MELVSFLSTCNNAYESRHKTIPNFLWTKVHTELHQILAISNFFSNLPPKLKSNYFCLLLFVLFSFTFSFGGKMNLGITIRSSSLV